MKTPTLFREYIWLVNTIRKARRITFEEINQRWLQTELSEGVELARSTFNRHRDAIEDMFGLIIDCDRRNGYKYFIANEEVLRENSVQNWMLSTLSVSSLVSESQSLHKRILLEDIPSGGDTLQQLIKAMKESHIIQIHYLRYGAKDEGVFDIAPYCLKLFHQRWYLLGRFENGFLAVFSLDRIENIKILDSCFKIDKGFDANSFFSECFGVITGDGTKTERIVIRAHGIEPYYLRDLPLHHSQRELQSTNDYTDFELFLRPTADFKANLLSRGQWVEVREPLSLKDELIEWHKNAIKRYE